MNPFKKIVESDDSLSEDSDTEEAEEAEGPSIHERAQQIRGNMVPKKSSPRYHIVYNEFLGWCTKEKIIKIDEDAILVYLGEISKKLAPTTLINKISILKRMLKINHNINIDDCPLVKVFLRDNVKEYEPKKSKTFTWPEINYFLDNAPDAIYLAVNVSYQNLIITIKTNIYNKIE